MIVRKSSAVIGVSAMAALVFATGANFAARPIPAAFHSVAAGPTMITRQLLGMRIRIPAKWTQHHTTTLGGVKRVVFTGSQGTLTMAQAPGPGLAPLIGYVATGTILGGFHPYLSASRHTDDGQVTYQAQELISKDTLLSLQLQVPAQDAHFGQQVFATWHHPRPLTPSQAVHEMFQDHTKPKSYVADMLKNGEGWTLVGGGVGTAQQAWYLFHSQNGDRSWKLETYTNWARPSHFMGMASPAAMRFLSASTGFIVQPGYASKNLLVYRTVTGGQHWKATTLPLPAFSMAAPVLHVQTDGAIELTAQRVGHQPPVIYRSLNQGRTWHLAHSSSSH